MGKLFKLQQVPTLGHITLVIPATLAEGIPGAYITNIWAQIITVLKTPTKPLATPQKKKALTSWVLIRQIVPTHTIVSSKLVTHEKLAFFSETIQVIN